MTWVATSGSTSYPIIDPQITKRLEGANTASFQCMANIPVGTIITIKYNGTNVYRGKVRSIRRRSDNLNTIELMEEASDLKLFRLEYGGSGIVTIANPNNDETLTSYISTILQNTGWTDGTGSSITTIPETSDPFPSLRFYNSTVVKALEKIITLVCGYKMWFNNELKEVKYGNYNTDRSATALSTIEVRPISSDINYGIDRVIVIGKTEDIQGVASNGGSPPKTLMYQYTECADNTEAQSIANQILADRSILMERFECDILPGNYIYNEGDHVRIADARTNTYGTYGVKDISITTEKTTLGLGCSEITIFDLLGDKLTEISGSSFNGVDEIWTGGKQNIGTTSPATYSINIADKAALGDFNLSLKLDRWSKDIALAGATSNFSIGEGGVASSDSDTKLSGLVSTGGTSANGTNAYNSNISLALRSASLVGTDRTLTYTAVNFTGASDNYIKVQGSIEGQHFLMLEFHMDIRFKGNTSYRNIYFDIYKDSSPPVTKTAEHLIYSLTRVLHSSLDSSLNAYPTWQVAHLDMCIPLIGIQGSVDDDSYFEIMVSTNTSTSGDVVIKKGYAGLVLIENHDHSFVPISHSNPISGASHDHATSTIHDNHSQTDLGHAHKETNNTSTIGSGPSSLSLSITNTLYPSGHVIESGISGGIRTYNKDISAFLSNGNNIISISSTTIGSVEASASFINYGK